MEILRRAMMRNKKTKLLTSIGTLFAGGGAAIGAQRWARRKGGLPTMTEEIKQRRADREARSLAEAAMKAPPAQR